MFGIAERQTPIHVLDRHIDIFYVGKDVTQADCRRPCPFKTFSQYLWNLFGQAIPGICKLY